MAASTAASPTLLPVRTAPRRPARRHLPLHGGTIPVLFSPSSVDLPSRPYATSAEKPRVPPRPLPGKPRESHPGTPRWGHPDFRRWKEKETVIFKDVRPLILFVKDILHSQRYKDGECLSPQDEKVIAERLLKYHPRFEDKIGCGLDAIMVDRHPQFQVSRCLFVVRTDGRWIDFSYQKCLRAYLHKKYGQSDADRFINEHFKRT